MRLVPVRRRLGSVGLGAFLLGFRPIGASSFLHPPIQSRQCCRTPGSTSNENAFDFSSSLGWEEHYQQLTVDDGTTELEWHASIPLDTVAHFCLALPQSSSVEETDGSTDLDILMVGCGTSRLPDVILDAASASSLVDSSSNRRSRPQLASLTLLDSSPTCIDVLKTRYQAHAERNKLRYVCGDAVALSATLERAGATPQREQSGPSSDRRGTNVIVDKGLMDALMCSEGWDGSVSVLLQEVSNVLQYPGTFVLVSYALTKPTKAILTDCGTRVGLDWEFDCEGSNSRVSISVASKVRPV